MDIKLESQLLPIISKNFDIFASGLSEISEFGSGFGIADLVYFSLNKDIILKRKTQKIEPIDSYELLKILTFLNSFKGDKISLTLIKKLSPKSKHQDIITYLVEKEFLIEEDEDEFYLGQPYKIGLKEVVAVEAKMSNWSRGLYQAYRYKQFANKSYLALYSKYIHRALVNKNLFEKCNIGLIEVTNQSIITHIEPQRENVKENIFSAVAYERLLRFYED